MFKCPLAVGEKAAHCGRLNIAMAVRPVGEYKGTARYECDSCLKANMESKVVDKPPGFSFLCVNFGCDKTFESRHELGEHRKETHRIHLRDRLKQRGVKR